MKKILIFTILSFLVISCKYVNIAAKRDVVAEIKGKKLYRSEVSSLIPSGTPAEDSIEMVKQYINRWALKHLLLIKAESELSKEERDVNQELEDYRSSLLMYRYEKNFIDQRLDTNITTKECMDYYERSQPSLIISSPVVKVRLTKISNSSPNYENIRISYKAQSIEEIEEFERLCSSSAEKYSNFNNEWVDLSTVAREVPFDVLTLESEMLRGNAIEINDPPYSYLIYFTDKIYSGSVAPFEYYLPSIKEIILSKRKQQLISDLERNLIQEAIDKNYLKTNIKRQ